MSKKAGPGKALDEILPGLENFLPIRDITAVFEDGNDVFTY
jgi:hypothetical protein